MVGNWTVGKRLKTYGLLMIMIALLMFALSGCSNSGGDTETGSTSSSSDSNTKSSSSSSGSSSSSSTASQEPAKNDEPPLTGVKLSISFSPPTLGNIVGYKAMEIMEHWGVKVTSVEIVSTGTALQAIVAGQNQIGEGSVSQGYSSVHAGANLAMVGGHDSGNDWVLVTRKDITSLDELKGRLYALGSTKGEDPTLRNLAFSLSSLDPTKEPTAILGGNGDRARAILAGQADAANLHLPWYNFLEAQTDDVHVLLKYAEKFPAFLSDFYWTSKDWAEKNEDVVIAWEMANMLAARWVFDHPDAALEYAGEKIPEFDAKKEKPVLEFFIDTKMWKPNGAMDMDVIQDSYNILRENVGFDGPPLNIEDFALAKFDQAALKKLGEYKPGSMPENLPADLPDSIRP